MKDIHNHILFGVDDGSKNLEESIKLIEKAVENGYTDLILTPHYRMFQDFVCDNREKYKIFTYLQQEVMDRNIPIRLFLGNEITLDDDFFYYLETRQILSLNNSRYLLLELPFFSKYEKLDEVLSKLEELNYIPIISHPERYHYYKIEDFHEMILKGVLFQGNIGSLYGKYGIKSKELLEEMLKRHMIHFIGSDIHHEEQTSYSRIQDVINRLEILTGSKKMAIDLVDGNIEKVIKNDEFLSYSTRKRKRRLKLFRKTKNIERKSVGE